MTKVNTVVDQNTIRRRRIGVTGHDEQRSAGGYTVIAPINGSTVYLVDIEGNERHRWELPSRVGRHATILPNGNLAVNRVDPAAEVFFTFHNKYRGGYLEELDPAGNVVRSFHDPLAHHDGFHYPDGRLLYTTLEKHPAPHTVRGGVPGSEAPGGVIYSDIIREVSATGELLWEWHVAESLPVDEYPLDDQFSREHYPLINAVYPLGEDRVLASLRSASSVIIIDRASGQIVWRIQNPTVSQQHNAQPVGDGRILIFDNGVYRKGCDVPHSRAIEVDIATKEVVWQYKDRSPQFFFSPFMGSVQRLDNGNTLICESAFGRVFEVTQDGTVVWEFLSPYFSPYPDDEPKMKAAFPGESNAMFRAYRYPASAIPWLRTGGSNGVY